MFRPFPIIQGKPPNARHQPPRIQLRQRQVSRMKATLFAVGCMALLCLLSIVSCNP